MEAKWVLLLNTLLVLLSTAISEQRVLYVGGSFTWQCGHNEAPYWWLNGRPTGVIGNQYRVVNATVDNEGTLSCTTTDEAESPILTFEVKILSLLGISPSPSNCSLADNSSNTCTVPVNSSLTLCADFAHYPSDAQDHSPDLRSSIWTDGNDAVILFCEQAGRSFSCSHGNLQLEPMPSVTAIGDWGRCLQLDKVTQNMSLSYEIKVKPNIEIYPTDKVLRSRTFNIQVTPSSTTPTPTEMIVTPSSTTPTPTETEMIGTSELAMTTPTPHPVKHMAIVTAVTVTVTLIVTVIIIILLSVAFYRCGYCSCQMIKSDPCIVPTNQEIFLEKKPSPPKTLQIAEKPYPHAHINSTTRLLPSSLPSCPYNCNHQALGDTLTTDNGSICSRSPFTPTMLGVGVSVAIDKVPSPSPPPSLLPSLLQMGNCLKVNFEEGENKSIASSDFFGGFLEEVPV